MRILRIQLGARPADQRMVEPAWKNEHAGRFQNSDRRFVRGAYLALRLCLFRLHFIEKISAVMERTDDNEQVGLQDFIYQQ
jgi:hypothetical protein